MKISYNNLKRFKEDLKNPEDLAEDLVMHTAEVEEIKYSGENLKDVFIGEVITCEKHPDSEKLNCTTVEVKGKIFPIVCGAPNVKAGQKVPVAVVGAKLSEDFVISKTKIRGETSEGMICSEDELGLCEQRQAGILELPSDAPLGVSMKDYLGKSEAVLDIDNKAINHRPDLFSHVGILREIYAINNEKFDYKYEDKDFSNLVDLKIENQIPKSVARYIGLKINGVENKETPDYIKEVLSASNCDSKGLLIDLSNYSLYFYGQPTHIFDADKVEGNIVIRFAKAGEKILALDDKEYELSEKDIVVADCKNILAIAGIIGGKNSAVTESTKNIIIESANFDHATLRASGKRLGLRTDALNIFEKDLLPVSAKWGVSLIVSELEKVFPNMKLESYSDCYLEKQKQVEVDYDLDFVNNLIGKEYSDEIVKNILINLGIEIKANKLIIPAWRKELNYKADIAEEIARIDGYDNIESQVPKIQLGAVIQNNTYKLKKLSRDFFTSNGFYDMYTYSFVNENLMKKCNSNIKGLVPLKNFLSEDATHMKSSLIPNLLLSLEKNKVDYKSLKLFEVEKVFKYDESSNKINENYNISGIITSTKDIVYYDMQNIVSKFLKKIGVSKFEFRKNENTPSYSHTTRTASIIARGQEIGVIGEIKPRVVKNFELKNKLGFFEIDLDLLAPMISSIIKAKDLSEFQSSNFDISFAVAKDFNGNKLKNTILKTNNKVISKVELTDIYENEEKLPGKRSITFKVFLQKMDSEIKDNEKNEIISEIIKKAEKLGAEHR